MHDELSHIAQDADQQLAKLYLSITLEVLIMDVALLSLLFAMLGFSTFILLQAFGITLLLLVIGSAILQFRKKSIRRRTEEILRQKQIAQEEWLQMLRQSPAEYEFLHALYLSELFPKH